MPGELNTTSQQATVARKSAPENCLTGTSVVSDSSPMARFIATVSL